MPARRLAGIRDHVGVREDRAVAARRRSRSPGRPCRREGEDRRRRPGERSREDPGRREDVPERGDRRRDGHRRGGPGVGAPAVADDDGRRAAERGRRRGRCRAPRPRRAAAQTSREEGDAHRGTVPTHSPRFPVETAARPGAASAGRPRLDPPWQPLPPAPERRRPRRGSLERPINGRLYRGTWLLVGFPLLVLAFSVARPAALQPPSLPLGVRPRRGRRARRATSRLHYPIRTPGHARRARRRALVRRAARRRRLHGATGSRSPPTCPGRGTRPLPQPARAASPACSPEDDRRHGPPRRRRHRRRARTTTPRARRRSIELARAYAPAGRHGAASRCRTRSSSSRPTAAATAALGAARFAAHAPERRERDRRDQPRRDRGQRPAAARARRRHRRARRRRASSRPCARELAREIGARAGRASAARPAHRPRLPVQPLRAGAVRRPRHAGGDDHDRRRPARRRASATRRSALQPDAARRRSAARPRTRSTRSSRASRCRPGRRATSTSAAGSSAAGRSRSCSSRRSCRSSPRPSTSSRAAGGAGSASRRRCAATAAGSRFWLWCGAPLRPLRAARRLARRRRAAAVARAASAGPPAGLIGLGVLAALGWFVTARAAAAAPARAARRRSSPGHAAALLALGVVGLLVVATNPFALLFVLPVAPRLALAAAGAGRARSATRLAVLLLGFAGPALLLWSFASRYGLGLDAPWYIAWLFALGYAPLPGFVIALAWAAARRPAARARPAGATRRIRARPSGRRAARSARRSGASCSPARRRRASEAGPARVARLRCDVARTRRWR